MKLKYVLIAFVALISLFAIQVVNKKMKNVQSSNSTLRILVDPYWGNLTPFEQSTSLADTLMGDVFEPLVDLSTKGGITSGVAERWDSNADDTQFIFYLRKDARFSNGEALTAQDFIDAWLSAATEDVPGNNPNSLDVLYRVKGFTLEKAKKRTVEGLKALTPHSLEVTFSKPFRTALSELSGTRYGAWKRDPTTGQVIGTGPYVISKNEPGKLVEYVRNPFSWRAQKFQGVTVKGSTSPNKDLCEGKGDLYVGRKMNAACEGASSLKLELHAGSIQGHYFLSVNGLPNTTFADSDARLALQYLILQHIHDLRGDDAFQRVNQIDAQFYPPFFKGRLAEEELTALINQGKRHIDKLVARSQRMPIRFITSLIETKFIYDLLVGVGVKFNAPFSIMSSGEVIKIISNSNAYDFDLAVTGAMVVGEDPDSLYHLLGRNGAIHDKTLDRPHVMALLEKFRSLTSGDDLDRAYQQVNRAIFLEVPAVHLFFMKLGYLSSGNVKLQSSAVNSDRFSFERFIKL